MPEIAAFRGIRYDLGHVGALSDVVAPPYDVIDESLQAELYKRHPSNVVRLILNRDEPGDQPGSRYRRAARFLKDWLAQGVLFREADPALYVYHQVFREGGTEYTRRGFMARVRLSRFGEGNIYAHEETMAGPKQDRLALMQACRANLSQVFGLYPAEGTSPQSVLEKSIGSTTPLEATDHLGVVHRMWPVTDVDVIARVVAEMAPRSIFIADGHHRYETACHYRDALAAEAPLDADHPANFVLMMCVSMSDPGMIVLPTHRLFRGLPALSAEQLRAALGEHFDVEPAGHGPTHAEAVWRELESRDDQGTIGFYTQADGKWSLATVADAGRARLGAIAPKQSTDWRGLGVAILHRLAIEDLLRGRDLPKPRYSRLLAEVSESLASGEFPLAALVMPATLEHIRHISEHGERMPAKSTYFYPKLLSGLVLNPLD